MFMIKVILTISLLIIALSGQNDNMCFKYLEDIEIFNQIKEQPFYKEYKQYYIGSKQEYQKQALQYCKGLQLWIFQDNQFNEPIEQQQSTLDENQLIFQLNDVPVYEKYYAFIHESQKLKFKVQNMKIEFIYQDNQQRLLGTYTNIQSELMICETQACTKSSDRQIYINDPIYLKQFVTDTNFTDYYLTNTEIYYTGSGWLKKGTINTVENSIKGQAIILVKVPIAWSELAIQVTSTLSNSIDGSELAYRSQTAINTIFWPLDLQLKLFQDQMCATQLDSTNIHLNDEIFVKFSSSVNYYLTNTTFYLIGNGVNMTKTPLAIDNSEKGNIIAFLKIDIVLKNVYILMQSHLSKSAIANQNSYQYKVSAVSEKISCILVNSDPLSCPTCEEECSINKFNEKGCEPCVDNNIKIIRNMIMILLISFY